MEQRAHRLDERTSCEGWAGGAMDHSQNRGQAVTAKARPRWAGDADERRRVMRAGLARLAELTADLPPVDAVAVSRQSREALKGQARGQF